MENCEEDQKILGLIKSFEQKYIISPFEFNQRLELSIEARWNHRRLIFDEDGDFKESETNLLSSELIFSEVGNKKDFYTIVMMMFPENANTGTTPLKIDIADTLFYLMDNSIVYVFKDAKKGLTKIKNKNMNVCELFLKRRTYGENYTFGSISANNFLVAPKKKPSQHNSQHNFGKKVQEQNQNSFFLTTSGSPTIGLITMNNIITEQKTSRFLKDGNQSSVLNLNYVAILKYKDNSSIRLKQHEFRAIFTNPLYANERFKNNNNTQYIQALPNQPMDTSCTFDQRVEFRIYFNYDKFANQQLFKLACHTYSQQSREFMPNSQKRRDSIKDLIKMTSVQVYLHYIVFQIYCYISMHYNKKIQQGQFCFVKTEKDDFLLAGVDQLSFKDHQETEFYKINLFQNKNCNFSCLQQKQNSARSNATNLFQDKVEIKTEFEKEVYAYFEKVNLAIKSDVTNFVCQKMEKIRNTKDKTLSKLIFKMLHPEESSDFHDLLKNEMKLEKILKPNTNFRESCHNKRLYQSKNVKTQGKITQDYRKTMGQSNVSQLNSKSLKKSKAKYKKYGTKTFIFTGI